MARLNYSSFPQQKDRDAVEWKVTRKGKTGRWNVIHKKRSSGKQEEGRKRERKDRQNRSLVVNVILQRAHEFHEAKLETKSLFKTVKIYR